MWWIFRFVLLGSCAGAACDRSFSSRFECCASNMAMLPSPERLVLRSRSAHNKKRTIKPYIFAIFSLYFRYTPVSSIVQRTLFVRKILRCDPSRCQRNLCHSAVRAAKEIPMLRFSAPSSIVNMQWSPDQRSFVFVEQYTGTVAGDYYPAFLHVLNAASGKVQKLSTFVGAGPPKLAWLDNRYIYMLIAGQATYVGISLLDTNSGGDPSIVPNSSFTGCLDFAGGYDGSKLFVSQCASYVGQTGEINGPSSITERPATGGTPTTNALPPASVIRASRSSTSRSTA